MRKYRFLILGLLFLLPSVFFAKEQLIVGVYQDEPLVMIDKHGNVKGFFIDILKYIALKEGWEIEYVNGSFVQCLEKLDKGEIDIMVDVPYSTSLREKYDFTNTTLLSSWAQVYTQKNLRIVSILELDKKKIAGVEGDIYFQEFKLLIESFLLNCKFVELNENEAVFRFLEQKMADVGVVSRIYGMGHERNYKVDRTPIACCPVELCFAFPKGKNPKLVEIIDKNLESLKNNKSSIYYRALDKWFEGIRKWIFPTWLVWTLLFTLAFLIIFLMWTKILSGQIETKENEIANRNKELEEEINERKRVHDKLITTLNELEQRVKDRTAELSQSNELLKKEIAERKQTEDKLRKMTAELERSNRELKEYAYVASHDLQEPLRMVSSYLQLLEQRYRDRLDKDAQEFITYAVDGSIRMKKLVESLLEYSRVDTHSRFEKTDCNTLIKSVLDNLKVAIEKNGAEITYNNLPEVMGDSTQLTQLFQNLISNAIKFRSDISPRIHIGVESRGGEWLFSIQDNGIGIDPKNFERIFLLFQRLHTPNEYPGVGVGLAVCKKIVERHGGKIWVESQPGKGSTFFFTIPEK